MVKAVTSFGRSGLSEWLVQRVSALILLAYVLVLLSVLLCRPEGQPLTAEQWKAVFSCTAMRVFSTLTLLAVVAHAWIGAWSVLTDYVTPRFFKLELGMDIGQKATVLRLALSVALVLLMAVYTLWGIQVFWGK